MKLVLSFLVVLASQVTFAQSNSCLSRASDQDLLREVSRRMSSSPGQPEQGSSSLSFTCAGNAEVIVDSINLGTGKGSQLRIAAGSWDKCRGYANILNSKLSGSNVSGKVFAICAGNAEVSKFTITRAGDVVLSSKTAAGDWDVCESSANQINSKL